jgi:hypothetical protein
MVAKDTSDREVLNSKLPRHWHPTGNAESRVDGVNLITVIKHFSGLLTIFSTGLSYMFAVQSGLDKSYCSNPKKNDGVHYLLSTSENGAWSKNKVTVNTMDKHK